MKAKRTPFLLAACGLLGSCAMHHSVVGDKAFDRMAYAEAARHYEAVLQRRPDDREAALRAAKAYHLQNQHARAQELLAHAATIAPLTREEDLLRVRSWIALERYDEARKQVDRSLKETPEDEEFLALQRNLDERTVLFADTSLFTLEHVELPGISNAFSPSPCGDKLLIAADRPISGSQRNPWNGESFLDLYLLDPATGTVTGLPGDVNGRFHEGPAVLAPDGRTLYFTRSDYFRHRLVKDESSVSHLQLFRATLHEDGNWTDVRAFAYNMDGYSTGHPALSMSGDTLFFSSDRPGGLGGSDLYMCTRLDSSWSVPENLGPVVNTPGDDVFPTINGKDLHYSSTGHLNLGGLDIFRTRPTDDGGWAEPENLGYPLNTSADDLGLVLSPDGWSGHLSSDRNGDDAIYAVSVHPPTLAVYGHIVDDEEGAPMAGAEVKLLDMTTGEALTFYTEADGSYLFPLKAGHNFRIKGSKDGMFTESRDIDTQGQRVSHTYEENFDLARVVVDKPIVVENIYYDYDKWDIRPEAAQELDKLVRLFNDNPQLSFELSSHTDSRASDTYNLVLSEARANSAVDYLVRSGVDAARITAKGYGEGRPVNRCVDGVECSEEEHQENRRTEFKVTGIRELVSSH